MSSTRPASTTAPVAHHRHPVGHAGDDAHVVADQHDGGLQLGLQIAHDLQDLGLHRDVERGGRLVGDEQVGAAHHRHRDHHALAHAAGKLVRILPHAAHSFGDAHQLQHLQRALLRLVAGQALMDEQTLHDLRADRHVRGQRGERVLEDHRDLRAAQPVQRLGTGAQDLVAAIPDAARGAAVAGEQPDGGEEELALAGAGFADDADALGLADGEVEALDRVDLAVGRREPHVEVPDVEDRRGHQRSLGSRASRKPSPMKLKQNSVVAMNAVGNSSIQG